MDDLIGVYDGVLTPEQCRTITGYFDQYQKLNLTWSREQEGVPRHAKNDTTIGLLSPDALTLSWNLDVFAALFGDQYSNFWKAWVDYAKRYSILQQCSVAISSVRFQKTRPGEGYHSWHFESDNLESSRRLATWMIYLNDVTEGGETEFLYLSKRIAPRAGTLLFWPAGYTHTHRGNPPLREDKFVITSWMELTK